MAQFSLLLLCAAPWRQMLQRDNIVLLIPPALPGSAPAGQPAARHRETVAGGGRRFGQPGALFPGQKEQDAKVQGATSGAAGAAVADGYAARKGDAEIDQQRREHSETARGRVRYRLGCAATFCRFDRSVQLKSFLWSCWRTAVRLRASCGRKAVFGRNCMAIGRQGQFIWRVVYC